MIIEHIGKHLVKFSMDSSNGEMAGKSISKTNKIVKDLLDGKEPVKEPIVEQVIEPTMVKPKRKHKKVFIDAPRD